MVEDYILDKVLDKIKEIIGTLSTNIFKRSIISNIKLMMLIKCLQKIDERWWKVIKCW